MLGTEIGFFTPVSNGLIVECKSSVKSYPHGLFPPQSLNRIEPCGFPRRPESENEADRGRNANADHDCPKRNVGGKRRILVHQKAC